MSIRWKIALLSILLAILPIVFLNSYTVDVFDAFTRKMLEEQMIDYAHVIAEDYRRQVESPEPGDAFRRRLQRYQREFGARLQIVDSDGTLAFDSEPDADIGITALDRREVQLALDGRYGARTALTPDHSLLYYHIALPVRTPDNRIIGAACVQAHTAAITRTILKIVRDYRLTMALTLGLSILTAVALSSTLTKRLRELTQMVNGFARGDSPLNIRTNGGDEIGALARAFSAVANEIKQTNTRQRDLLASTTHQLKTPLTAIKGAVQILQTASDDPVARDRFLKNIDTSADRLLDMVEQLAVLSSLKTEELRGRKSQIDYTQFIQETLQRLYPTPTVPIDLDLPDSVILVSIIPGRIEQVISNLVDNALRYTPETGRITIRVTRSSKRIETTITDTGCGIERSDLPRIFDHFFTTETPHGGQGSGLGLAIAQSIIQNHGGAIHATSTAGEGSTFSFWLPLNA